MSKIAPVRLSLPPKISNLKSVPRGSKYDLDSLEAGSDMCILLDGIDAKKLHSRLSSAVANYRKLPGNSVKRFTIRTVEVEEDGVTKTKVGVWRVADELPAGV